MRPVLAALAVAGALAVSRPAEACSCVVPDVVHDYNTSDSVVIGMINAQTPIGPWVVYTVRVLRDLKGCTPPGTTIRIGTPDSAPACGASLPLRTPLLLFSSESGVGGSRQLVTTSCMPNMPPSMLTPADRTFLGNRPVTCGGVTTCNDGSSPLVCLVDPCSVAPACPGATCRANYCGGCTAEFYTPDRYAACTPW